MCGENIPMCQIWLEPRWLIPACAGKTERLIFRYIDFWAHPRVCGENMQHAGELLPFEGSSPRVRGKLNRDTHGLVFYGLIPACAGKTRRASSACSLVRAHPRVCGENPVAGSAPVANSGSSPRVRGKRHVGPNFLAIEGLIPACAGKTRH